MSSVTSPDTLFEQELRSRHSHLLALGLHIRTLTGAQVGDAYGMREQLFAEVLVPIEEIEHAYERMKNSGRRFPWTEVSAQLNRFRGGR